MNNNGWLKHGNPAGDLSQVPRCGAKNRKGTACQCPAMPNGRCRLHGGLSTGPKTAEGIERIRKARTKHGRHTAAAKEQRRDALQSMRKYLRQEKEAAKAAQQQLREFKRMMKALGL